MINGISDRQSTHLVQEPRSCVQTKARMLCFCMRHLPRPPLCTQKRRRNSKVNWKQKFWRLSVVDQERQYSRSGQAKERGTTRPPPLPRTFFYCRRCLAKAHYSHNAIFTPRVSVIGVISGKLDKLLGEGGKLTCDWLASHWEEYSWVPTFYEQPEHHEI